MKLRLFIRSAVLGALVVAAALSLPPDSFCATGSYKVTDVVDGDTVTLSNGRNVRYIGIDTPEVRRRQGRQWLYAPEPYALQAKELNAGLVSGREVTLEFDQRREDKYGRWLCYVYNGDRMVNEEMLRNGLAIFNVYPPNNKYVERLVAAQDQAKREKLGLWKDLPVISDKEAFRYDGKVVTVRGTVADIGLGKSTVYLNFVKGKKDDFTAVIWKSNVQYFKGLGFAVPEGFLGRTIEVTGKIKNDNGPQMVVYHPSQIKVIEK